MNCLVKTTIARLKQCQKRLIYRLLMRNNSLSLVFTSSLLFLLQININMNFFYSFVTLYNPNTPQPQFFQYSYPSLVQNAYQPSNIYTSFSQLQQQNPFIFTTNFTTQDSLTGGVSPKPAAKKKKPAIKKDQDQTFGWRMQNKDRNIMSNILKAFVNYIHDEIGMRPHVEKLYSKLNLSNDVSEFYIFFIHHFPITRSYFSAKFLKTFLRDTRLPQSLLMILKLLLNRFLRVDFPLILLKSTKIRRRSKLEQMKKSRDLIESLFRE